MDKKLEPQNIESWIVDGKNENEGEELREEKREEKNVLFDIIRWNVMWLSDWLSHTCIIYYAHIQAQCLPAGKMIPGEKKRETHIHRTVRHNPFSGEKNEDSLVYFSSIFCVFSILTQHLPRLLLFRCSMFDVQQRSSHIDIIHFSIFSFFVPYLLISLSHITHVNS